MAARKRPYKKRKILTPLTPARKRKVLRSLRELEARIQRIEILLKEGDFDDY
jgi:hypothetical protein